MIEGKSIIAIIPARGGSKGVPRKNIRKAGGKPLIAWTIEEAKKSKYIDRVILSSDDEEIISVSKSWGCEVPFIRPPELASDNTPGIDPVLHAVEKIPGYDYIVLLQPTSPLRIVSDIDGCIELCVKQKADSVVSVTQSEKSPYWMYTVDANGRIVPVIQMENNLVRRQELPKVYVLNGAVYVSSVNWLKKTRTLISKETMAYLMPQERSLDIDTEYHFRLFEFILKDKGI